MTKLPDLPSELLTLALDDLEVIRKDPKYRIFMLDWHLYLPQEDVCQVCLAGAVMANTLKIDRKRDAEPLILKHKYIDKLIALDNFREGEVHSAFESLDIEEYPEDMDWIIDVPQYHIDPEGFISTLRALAQQLKERGL